MAVQIYQQRRDMINGGSGFYFGPAGTGKTYALKNEIEHVLENTEGTVFVISKKGEYNELAEKLEGLVIDLAKQPLNPLLIQDTSEISEQDVVFLSKIKLGLVRLLIETKLPKLTSLQKYLIEQVMLKQCLECGDLDWNQLALAFNNMIESYKNKKIAKKLDEVKASLDTVALELNLSPASSDNILLKDTFLEELSELAAAVTELNKLAEGKKQINIGSHRLVIFDVTNVAKEDVDKYCLMAIEDVWTRLNGVAPITEARLLIDDADTLFKSYDKYLAMMYKVSKAQGFVITSAIEDTTTFLTKRLSFRNISGYFEIFGHSMDKIDILKPLFSLSPDDIEWLTKAPKGQKLVLCGGNRFLVKAVK
ncbi:MAG: hypothetical protein K0R46_136 [Herbinix sp.]|jgi:hypothetical protein|nr:hypothetical protein [Herbinix sp.]